MRLGKQDRANEERTAVARKWADEGHTRYVQRAKIGNTQLGPSGLWEDITMEIEAIEAGGWALQQLVYGGNSTLVILVFARA